MPGTFLSLDQRASAADGAGFTIRQGTDAVEITPLSNGESVSEFYDYSNAESHTTTDLERPRTSIAFLWEGPDGISLVLIHGGPDDGYGGAVSMDFEGLPSGSWQIQDDPRDWDNSRNPPSVIDWTWGDIHNDGGAYQGDFGNNTALTVHPSFNQDAHQDPLTPGEIEEWQFLTGNAADPERIALDVDAPLEIFGGEIPPSAPPVRAEGGPAPGEITVEWGEPGTSGDHPILGYNVYRAPSANETPQRIVQVGAEERSYTDSPPRQDEESTYWVTAFSAAGESPLGGPDCAVPAPNEPLRGCSPPGGRDIFSDGFEEGTLDWLPFYPWHEAIENDTRFPNAAEGRVSFWFGREETGTYEGTYENGRPYDLVSPVLDLRATEAPVLSFETWYETEHAEANVDEKTLLVTEPGTNGHAVLKEIPVTGEEGFRQWTNELVDLSEFVDRQVELRFRFTPSATDNAHRGWYIDHVRVFEDHDTDGVPTGQERLDGTDPFDADTDDDGENDREDDRPLTEDVPPSWGYWFEEPPLTGRPAEVYFLEENGLVHVNVSAPQDNVGVGEVWFALELGGHANGTSVNGTMRFQLHQTAGGRYTATFPLPRNFEGGQATFQKVVLAASDVNGNWVALPGWAQDEISFRHEWHNRTQDGFAFLESVDLPEGREGQANSPASVSHYTFRVPPDGDGVLTSRNVEEWNGTQRNLLVPTQFGAVPFPFTPPVFTDIPWDGLISGTEEESAEKLNPTVHGFVFGCDEAPNAACFGGDALAGFLVVGDIRDASVGLIQHDRVDFVLGSAGLALEANQGVDGVFSTLKPPLKVIGGTSPTFVKTIVKHVKTLGKDPKVLARSVDELKTVTYTVAKNIGDRPGMAKRLLKFDDAFPSKRALLTLSDEAAVKAVDDLVAKYGADFDTLAAKLAEDGSKIGEPEDLVAIATAEKHLVARGEGHFAQTLLEDFAKVRDADGVKSVLRNMETAAPQSVKGYAFEAKMAAKLEDQSSTIQELNRLETDFGIPSPNSKLDIDAEEVNDIGEIVLNEFKSGKVVGSTETTRNQILKLEKAVKEDNLGERARIVISSESRITDPLADSRDPTAWISWTKTCSS